MFIMAGLCQENEIALTAESEEGMHCSDCGTKIYNGRCSNCHEELYIFEEQIYKDGMNITLSDKFVKKIESQKQAIAKAEDK